MARASHHATFAPLSIGKRLTSVSTWLQKKKKKVLTLKIQQGVKMIQPFSQLPHEEGRRQQLEKNTPIFSYLERLS